MQTFVKHAFYFTRCRLYSIIKQIKIKTLRNFSLLVEGNNFFLDSPPQKTFFSTNDLFNKRPSTLDADCHRVAPGFTVGKITKSRIWNKFCYYKTNNDIVWTWPFLIPIVNVINMAHQAAALSASICRGELFKMYMYIPLHISLRHISTTPDEKRIWNCIKLYTFL